MKENRYQLKKEQPAPRRETRILTKEEFTKRVMADLQSKNENAPTAK